MFLKRQTWLLFIFICAIHAIAFFTFFSWTISNALDGSHRKSFLDWIPFAVFLATFSLQALPGLRSAWKAAPVKMLVSLVTAVFVLLWLFAFIFRQLGPVMH
ncbi:hypothetical protein D1B31_00055 [Neobacillus notoginsengisoli]|uniref:Uncharacterized protein n=1 Tax=Neobacillus notoginsengisoli TaxID=1578198 RepID=A0A417YYW9_9BACI|nr:hypothetical protein [Neobacillus notoginsengisoli]RHW43110.1 hypothetical protein D1B31_00055 [Neobacillus notoginsengisoli]